MKKIIFVLPVFLTSFSLMSQTLKEIVSNVSTLGSIPFSVSGNIDRYKWTNSSVRYMGDNYNVAFINNSTNVVANSKWNFWNNPCLPYAQG